MKHFEDYRLPWHMIFAIVALLIIVSTSFIDVTRFTEGMVVLTGWIMLVISFAIFIIRKKREDGD